MLNKVTASVTLGLYTNVSNCQSVIKRHLKDVTFNRDLSIYQFYALLTGLGFEVVSFEVSWFIQFNPLRTQAITRLSSANGIVEYYVNRIGWIHIKHVHVVVNECVLKCVLHWIHLRIFTNIDIGSLNACVSLLLELPPQCIFPYSLYDIGACTQAFISLKCLCFSICI